MSLFTEASLVMIPSGVKDGKLYSIKPDDGVGDFTFTRGSNLAATRVDENGLIEKGRENLLLYSNDFSNPAWFKGALINVDFNGTDPLGGNTAIYAESSGNSSIYQDVSTTIGNIYTWSFYGKSTTTTSVAIRYNSTAIDITLTTEWKRFKLFFTAASTTTRVWIGAGFSWTSGEVAHIAFPQLELGLVATDYIETGATSEQAGILENLPRLDYTDSSCPSLLLEPTRTNLVTQSEYFASSDWSDFIYSGASINKTFGYASPENKNNAYKWDIVTGTGGVLVTDNITVTASVDYSLSVWMKGEVGGEKVRLDFKDTSSAGVNGPLFTLTTEWVRYEVSVTNSAGTSRGFQFRMLQSEGVGSQTIYVYGAQLEAGSYPTSYIPTYGTSVTRSRDLCVGAGDATTFNDSEGVLFVEVAHLDPTEIGTGISVNNGSISNRISIGKNSSFSPIVSFLTSSGTQDSLTGGNFVKNEFVKIAVKYKSGDNALWVNGVEVDTSTFASTPLNLNNLSFDAGSTGLAPFLGRVKNVIYFPTALTDSELAALTTI